MKPLTLAEAARRRAPDDHTVSYGEERMFLWWSEDVETRLDWCDRAGRLVLSLVGPILIPAIEDALSEVIRRQENLRARYALENGRLRKQVLPPYRFEVPIHDLQGVPAAGRMERALQYCAEQVQQRFDPAVSLWQMGLVRLEAEQHLLWTAIDHMSADLGASGIFWMEFLHFYRGFAGGTKAALPEPKVQYSDFAYWERHWLPAETLEQTVAAWRADVEGITPINLKLPTDFPREPVDAWRKGRAYGPVPVAFFGSRSAEVDLGILRKLAARERATPFVLACAAFAVQLQQLSHQEDLAVCSTLDMRATATQLQQVIGFMTNPYLIRLDLKGNTSLIDVLRRTRDRIMSMYQRPIETIPLVFPKFCEPFRIMFQFVGHPNDMAFEFPGASATVLSQQVEPYFRPSHTYTDLHCAVNFSDKDVLIHYDYNTGYWRPDTMAAMAAGYIDVLKKFVTDPAMKLSEL